MPTIVGDAFIEIKPDTRNFAAQAKGGVEKEATSLAKTAALAFGATFAAAKVFSFGKQSVEAAEEARKIAAQTAAVIKSTGGVANVTGAGVDKLATKISKLTGIDDEAIAKAENLLLTFTNVRNELGQGNDVFDQATQVLVDMGAALGKDAAGSAVQLGKALNDPVKGITALTRVGVTFTAQQKETIKQLVAQGDVLGAQKIILAELTTEFGGSAAAQATASDKLGVVIDNIKEDIGEKLLPIIDDVATGLSVVLPKALDIAESAFGAAADIFSPLIQAGEGVFNFFFDPDSGALGKSNWERGVETIKGVLDRFFIGSSGDAAEAAKSALALGIPEATLQERLATSGESGLLGVTLANVQHDKEILAIADDNASTFDKIESKIANTIAGIFGLDLTSHASQFSEDLATGFGIIKDNFTVGAIEVHNFLSEKVNGIFNFIDDPNNRPDKVFGRLAVSALDGFVDVLGSSIGDHFVVPVVTTLHGAIDAVGAGVDAIIAVPGQLLDVGVSIVKEIAKGIVSAPGLLLDALGAVLPKASDIPGLIVKGAKGLFGKAVSIANPFGATGGQVSVGGVVLVGEKGPELVRLPSGSQIVPNDQLGRVQPASVSVPAAAAGAGAGVVGGTAGNTFHVEQMIVPAPPDAPPLEVAATIAQHFAWRFGMEAA